jgi:NADP-dependent 3-hydroxy acid dehydrogenase YdfG
MYRDKVILLTGAFSGIGRALNKLFMQSKARVVAVGRNPANDIPSYAGHYLPIVRDIRSEHDAEEVHEFAIDKFGHIDYLIHCTGSYEPATPDTLRTTVMERAMMDNFLAPAYLNRFALPDMKRRNSGHLMFLGDEVVSSKIPANCAHHAAKSALDGYVQTLRRDLADTKIRVQMLQMPGVLSHFWDAAPDKLDTSRFINVHDAARLIYDAGLGEGELIKPSTSLQPSV